MDYSSADWQDAQTYADFLADIKSKSRQEDADHYARHKAIINTKQYVYALKMSDIRLIAKQILKGDYDGFLKVAKNNSYEETIIQGIVIAQVKDIEKQIQYGSKHEQKQHRLYRLESRNDSPPPECDL